MLKIYIITTETDTAINQRRNLIHSMSKAKNNIDGECILVEATTPETLTSHAAASNRLSSFKWNWPLSPQQSGLDMASGLYKNAYAAQDQQKVIACAISHALLWEKCVEVDEAIMILESDAVFTRHFDYNDVKDSKWGALGLNDPRGTTRKASVFHSIATANKKPGVYNVPKVDEIGSVPQPQGLAGNCSYLIRPHAATQLLDAIDTYGLWPNDALMCQELFPWLRITLPFYTRVQGGASSTKG
jgi:GR25 family glycosyltransferase involved in LPS biosynthesis